MNKTLKIVTGNSQDAAIDLDEKHSEGWLAVCLRLLKLGKKDQARQRMHLVETLALGGKRQLMLVECWGVKYLVGCGPDAVQTIAPIAPMAPLLREETMDENSADEEPVDNRQAARPAANRRLTTETNRNLAAPVMMWERQTRPAAGAGDTEWV